MSLTEKEKTELKNEALAELKKDIKNGLIDQLKEELKEEYKDHVKKSEAKAKSLKEIQDANLKQGLKFHNDNIEANKTDWQKEGEAHAKKHIKNSTDTDIKLLF